MDTQLIAILKSRYFSLIIDETTDRSVQTKLVLMVQFYDFSKEKLMVEMLHMIECQDGSANGLSSAVLELLKIKGIPLHHMIGFCADTTNVMFGSNHSVVTELRAKIPSLATIKCSSHSIHLCSSYDCKELPGFLTTLVHDLYNYFARSPKRKREFAEYQNFMNCANNMILPPSKTRWLALENCANRILQ